MSGLEQGISTSSSRHKPQWCNHSVVISARAESIYSGQNIAKYRNRGNGCKRCKCTLHTHCWSQHIGTNNKNRFVHYFVQTFYESSNEQWM